MANVSVYNMLGNTVDTIELNDSVFGVEINEHLMHLAVTAQLANKRQGTQKAKTRSEVSGGGRKPWRQKGTGRARQGSTRSPQWTHGGVALGPKPRTYKTDLNKKVKRLALKSALSSKVADDSLVIVNAIVATEYKTKVMANMLNALGATGKTLVVLSEKNDMVVKSLGNIAGVKTAYVNTINVYDILNCDKLVIVEAAAKKIEEVYA